ncbi:ABC transporter permease [Taibaiella koreensis]|uniref:ABC transporter permease n=1 Tax=Taibaiella koreensis TaxID=1268548 RepID=UPI0013C2F2C8|nr:ABC transporter permease [Taibaiella koreensis]
MIQLLSIEWMKQRKYATFRVLTLLFALLLSLFYISIAFGWFNVGAGGITLFGKASSFSGVWDDLCFFASYFVIILAILVAIIATNEFQYRTNRQNIIDGWTRLQFFHAKWLLIIVFSLATTLFTFLLGLLSGIVGGLSIGTLFDGSEKLVYLFFLCLNYFGFALTLSFFFRRSGLSIGILMCYSLIVEAILHVLILFKYKYPAGDLFLPLQCSDELLPANPSRMLRATLPAGSVPGDWTYLGATVAWIVLYYLLGRRRLAKTDW